MPDTSPVPTRSPPPPHRDGASLAVPEAAPEPERSARTWALLGDRGWRSHLPFLALCVAVTVVRAWVLLGPGAPPGPDPGNWLAFGHGLLGRPVRSASLAYPPLVPLVVVLAVATFGLTAGVIVVALGAALVPAAATYVVLRLLGLGWRATLPAGFLLVASSTGEAVAWGGYPQLLAIGLSVALLWAFDQYLRSPSTEMAVAVGALAFAELATSHLIAAATAVVAIVLAALHLLLRPARTDGGAGRRRPAMLGLALAPCLVLVPLYVHLGQTVLRSFVDRPSADRLTPGTTLAALSTVLGDSHGFWRNATILAILTPFLLLHRRRSSLWLLCTSLAVGVALTVLIGQERRFVYLVPAVVVFALGCWLEELRAPADALMRRVGVAFTVVLVAALGIQAYNLPDTFRGHHAFYRVMTPGLVEGVRWLHGHTGRADVVAVGDVDGVPLGWWVEGLGERATLLGSDPRWLNFPDERARAEAAEEVFTEEFPSTASLQVARARGASWVLVPKVDGGYARRRPRVETFVAGHPELVAFENADTLILRVP